ncbi:hypothetical protein SCHPADRAFT_909162 [Schizopora paradoxa]|uniref:Uncharacterized protein n=1 Tax=Schizopora paradoxa TaxID=27342 RepID=A0A0H2RE37_9AGAM|nr:hypothetical protein SCHPADRAFT_909162 [Schizopora paradoxa]
MAFYDFYHRNAAAGGDLVPPQPLYQPQSSWSGSDYYRAQAQATDPSLYEYGFQQIGRRNVLQGGGMGAGIEEAKILHRRAYFGEMKMMMPADIGAAAAYEAWRNWSTYQGTYMQPLSADPERQREAFIGIAIGEAARLWGYTSNPMDTQGRLAAVEGASATAARIFMQGAGGSGYQGMANNFGMNPASPMGLGNGWDRGRMPTPGMGSGAMNTGNYLDIPQGPSMRRRSMSDLAAAQMQGVAGYDRVASGMGFGGGPGYGGAYGDGMSYGGGNTRYDRSPYSSGTPYPSAGGMDYERSRRGNFPESSGAAYAGTGGMMSAPGGAGFGMGVGGLAPSTELLSPGGLENRDRRRRPRSRSRHRSHRRRGSTEREMLGAEYPQGMEGTYGGYGGYGGYGTTYTA